MLVLKNVSRTTYNATCAARAPGSRWPPVQLRGWARGRGSRGARGARADARAPRERPTRAAIERVARRARRTARPPRASRNGAPQLLQHYRSRSSLSHLNGVRPRVAETGARARLPRARRSGRWRCYNAGTALGCRTAPENRNSRRENTKNKK